MVDENLIAASATSLEQLEAIVTDVARSPRFWRHAVRFDPERPTHRVLYKTDAVQITLFCWAAGQGTRFHDHGGASGAAFVCGGMLVEDVVEAVDGLVVRKGTYTRPAESAFSFGPDYIHRVRNDHPHRAALSIHAYTPALSDALDYDMRPDGTIRPIE